MDTSLRPIPEERALSAEEYRLTRSILEHGVPEAEPFLAQVDRARVVARCGCGRASVDFEVEGEIASAGGSHISGDFLYGNAAEPFGAFVFQRGNQESIFLTLSAAQHRPSADKPPS